MWYNCQGQQAINIQPLTTTDSLSMIVDLIITTN